MQRINEKLQKQYEEASSEIEQLRKANEALTQQATKASYEEGKIRAELETSRSQEKHESGSNEFKELLQKYELCKNKLRVSVHIAVSLFR